MTLCLLLQGFVELAGPAASRAEGYSASKEYGEVQAKMEADRKVYESYEKQDTLEGYSEFILKYPDNTYVDEARKNVEKIEFVPCDTAACLRGFIVKYPRSPLSEEARDRLAEAEIREFDKELREGYRFDLLLYRLNLNKLRKELRTDGKDALGSYSSSFSFAESGGKRYFATRLTFRDERVISKIASRQTVEEIFDDILSGQLEYLHFRFKNKEKVDGFSFEISLEHPGTYEREEAFALYFSHNEVNLLVEGRPERGAIFNKVVFLPLKERGTPVVVQKEARPEATPLPQLVLLLWTSEKDGMAKDGRFVRTAEPAFTFVYPQEWTMETPNDRYVFGGRDSSVSSSMRVMIASVSGSEAASIKSFAEIYARLLQKTGSDIAILYNKPTDVYEGFRAYEFEISYRRKGIPLSPVRTAYVNVVAKGGYAIILEGETPGHIDGLKTVYETLDPNFKGEPPKPAIQEKSSQDPTREKPASASWVPLSSQSLAHGQLNSIRGGNCDV
jgi:hypothetical protein